MRRGFVCIGDIAAQRAAARAQGETETETPSEPPATTRPEPVATMIEGSAELSGSAPFVPTDAASELPAEEPRWPPAAPAHSSNEWADVSGWKPPPPALRSESPIEGTRWTPTTLADKPSEISHSASVKKPSYLPPEWNTESPRLTVPESAARALEARVAADRAPVREPVAAPPPIREPVPSLPPRKTSAAFAILGLIVIAAAAYYGYRNNSFAPAIAWLRFDTGVPGGRAMGGRRGRGEPRRRIRANARNDGCSARCRSSAAPNPSDQRQRRVDVIRGSTRSAAAPASPKESANPSAATTPPLPLPTQPTPTPVVPSQSASVGNAVSPSPGDRPRERVLNRSATVATAPATMQPPARDNGAGASAPDNAGNAKAPGRCSDAATAMGLCRQDKSGEGT